MNNKKITVITSTLNAESYIPTLIKSLEKQTDKDFEWLIMDGKSSDNTLKLIENSKIENKKIYVEEDFGIYDAINKGIRKLKTKYYIVAGSDDSFEINAIKNFNEILNKYPGYKFYAARWIEDGVIQYPKNGSNIKHGMRSISSCHSIGLMIDSGVHNDNGYYLRNYPICADYEFVKRAINEGGCKQKIVNFTAGIYSTNGESAKNYIDYIFDMYKIKTKGKSNIVQLILLIIRLLRK